jgi:hypothetical protein
VQVDPIKPTLKAPGTTRLKVKYDERLSNFAFKFNLRRYNEAVLVPAACPHQAGETLNLNPKPQALDRRPLNPDPKP